MKSHDHSRSSANFSRLCLRSKSNASSSHNSTKKSKKISKYFVSTTMSEGNASTAMDMITTSDDKYNEKQFEESLQSTTDFESPYKNLTEISSVNVNINTAINEEKDFKTPERVFKRNLVKLKSSCKPSNNIRKGGRKPKALKNTKTSEQKILIKTIKENVSQTDANLEHLQLAIALSKSLQDNHKSESDENDASTSTSLPFPSTQQKVATIKQTLEQFGLRANTKRIDVQHRRIPVKRTKKKSRYQYITPVLLLRTEEDRKKIILEKVTSILSQNLDENVRYCSYKSEKQEPVSEKLKKQWNDDNRIFKLNNFELDTLENKDIFYSKSLNIAPSETKCGSLLKDWTKIPGREKSPLRKFVNENLAVNSEDNKTNSVSEQGSTKENIINSTINSNFISTATDNNTLSETSKNNLQITSFSNRSISPELFESDEEIVIPEKKSPQEILTPSEEEHSSQSLLNLTPQKKKSVHASPNKNIDSNGNFNSESHLSITPTKKDKSLNIGLLEKGNLDMHDNTSPILMNKLKNLSIQKSSNEIYAKKKSTSSDLSDDDLFVNDNGICTFESFSSDHICFDLTHSSDEENNRVKNIKDTNALLHSSQSSNTTASLKDVSFDNTHTSTNQTLRNTSPIISTGISEIMQKSMYFHEENVTISDEKEENVNISDEKDTPKTIRRSKSLNITEYINNMLDDVQVSIISYSDHGDFEPQQHLEAHKNNIVDLTQSSTRMSCSIRSKSASDLRNCNFIKEKVSESDNEDILSPIKSNKNYGTSRFQKHDSFKSTTSQESQESICISDEELNYSSIHGTPYIKEKQNSMYVDNYFYEISDDSNEEDNNLKEVKNSNYDDINLNLTPKTSKEALNNKSNLKDFKISHNCEMIVDSPMQLSAITNRSVNDNHLTLWHPRIKSLSRENTATGIKSRKSLFHGASLLDDSFNAVLEDSHLFDEVQNSEAGPSNVSKKANSENQNSKPDETNTTPKHEMIIKTTNVTPMINYNEIDTPKINKELQQFGLKPLKRQRGIQILKHIYESTHPVIGESIQNCEEPESDDGDNRVIKKRKSNSKIKGTKKSQSPRKQKSPKNIKSYNKEENTETGPKLDNVNIIFTKLEEKIEIAGDLMGENETVDDLIFERKHSTKLQSCKVPLHIAWHNLVSSQPELRKNILLYEPLQLEVLYKLLKEQGYKYHIQDLLTFLDRKCITIRTNQNHHRKTRQRGKSVSVSPQKCK